MQVKFRYDEHTVPRLERSVSLERLRPYFELAEKDRTYAIRLYEWNTRLSEALYGILQGFEVTLRNAIHEVMMAAYRREDWYEVAALLDPERRRIQDAKQRIRDHGRSVTPGCNCGIDVWLLDFSGRNRLRAIPVGQAPIQSLSGNQDQQKSSSQAG